MSVVDQITSILTPASDATTTPAQSSTAPSLTLPPGNQQIPWANGGVQIPLLYQQGLGAFNEDPYGGNYNVSTWGGKPPGSTGAFNQNAMQTPEQAAQIQASLAAPPALSGQEQANLRNLIANMFGIQPGNNGGISIGKRESSRGEDHDLNDTTYEDLDSFMRNGLGIDPVTGGSIAKGAVAGLALGGPLGAILGGAYNTFFGDDDEDVGDPRQLVDNNSIRASERDSDRDTRSEGPTRSEIDAVNSGGYGIYKDGGMVKPRKTGKGRMIKGHGDGRSDSVKAKAGAFDIKVSDGEYIVPADVVSAVGRGSSGAGAKRMDAFVDQARVLGGKTMMSRKGKRGGDGAWAS